MKKLGVFFFTMIPKIISNPSGTKKSGGINKCLTKSLVLTSNFCRITKIYMRCGIPPE